ncbi:unnamed protein product [Rangifer tarandus platyrhynchus]|uniref:Uncharacterized protein n=1 Tax=Rangifer tarandus platyrhynchus TaxID=3082113 RepID=A0AC60A5I2_RANTA
MEPWRCAPSLTPTHTSGRHVTPARASGQRIVQSAWAPSSAHLPEGLPCHLQAECHAENPHWFKNCLFFEMQNDTSKYYTTKRVKCCVAVKVNTAKRCDGCDLGLRQQVNKTCERRSRAGPLPLRTLALGSHPQALAPRAFRPLAQQEIQAGPAPAGLRGLRAPAQRRGLHRLRVSLPWQLLWVTVVPASAVSAPRAAQQVSEGPARSGPAPAQEPRAESSELPADLCPECGPYPTALSGAPLPLVVSCPALSPLTPLSCTLPPHAHLPLTPLVLPPAPASCARPGPLSLLTVSHPHHHHPRRTPGC